MPIPCYLALTAAEFANANQLPEKIAWMACHFSCYGTGLSNFPEDLPGGSVIILNDRTPPDKHDPQRILEQLQQLVEAEAKLKEMKKEQELLKLQAEGKFNAPKLWQGDIDDMIGNTKGTTNLSGTIIQSVDDIREYLNKNPIKIPIER